MTIKIVTSIDIKNGKIRNVCGNYHENNLRQIRLTKSQKMEIFRVLNKHLEDL